MFWLFVWLAFTLFISWINAKSVGMYWRNRQDLPLWTQLVLWSGAIMAVIGFFLTFLILVTWLMESLHLFEFFASFFFHITLTSEIVASTIDSVFGLAYLMIIFPILGTGLAITINSWIVAFRERSLLSGGIAAYNTFATLHNLINAFSFIPQIAKALYETVLKVKISEIPIWMWLSMIGFPIAISLGGAIVVTKWIMDTSDNSDYLN